MNAPTLYEGLHQAAQIQDLFDLADTVSKEFQSEEQDEENRISVENRIAQFKQELDRIRKLEGGAQRLALNIIYVTYRFSQVVSGRPKLQYAIKDYLDKVRMDEPLRVRRKDDFQRFVERLANAVWKTKPSFNPMRTAKEIIDKVIAEWPNIFNPPNNYDGADFTDPKVRKRLINLLTKRIARLHN